MLRGKHILLGISGGIAAYKTPYLVRLLTKAGAKVKIVLTESASHFVSPLTLATLSEHPVAADFTFLDEQGQVSWNNHVELGLWADLMIIAPATANTLSKMAQGQSDNLLLVSYLSAKCPIFIAPAMDLDMYKHPTTKSNLKVLEGYGHIVIPAEKGLLASGLSGEGRMAEPQHIVDAILDFFTKPLPLHGKKVVITAGPTYEPIDPVRFIGNRSSGLMGFALAEQAAQMGAKVILISGPTHLEQTQAGVLLTRVETALQMQEAVREVFSNCDVFIGAAAVADYRPKELATQKIKKGATSISSIALVENPDIIGDLGRIKKNQFLVGFALESHDGLKYAQDKLKKKNLDAIVLNTLEHQGAGFGYETNQISFIHIGQSPVSFPLKSKSEVAVDIWNEILKKL